MSARMIDIYFDDPVPSTALGRQARDTTEQLDRRHIVGELEHVLISLAR